MTKNPVAVSCKKLFRPHVRALTGALSVALLFSGILTAHASIIPTESDNRIVINDAVGPAGAQALAAAHPAVARVVVGGGICTGTLIAPTKILTAKHCTDGAGVAAMSVLFGPDAAAPILTRTVTAKLEMLPVPAGALLDGTDISVLTLSSAVPAATATPMKLWDGTPTGVAARTVGYGLNGVGSVGHGGTTDDLRWAGDNVIDTYGAAAISGGFVGGSANIFSTDFDDGSAASNTLTFHGSSAVPLLNEATTAPGDSGGPLIVQAFGESVVIAALSGGTTSTSVYGDISWWTGIGPYRSTLEAHGAVFAVPEPSAFLYIGLIALVFVGRQKMRVEQT